MKPLLSRLFRLTPVPLVKAALWAVNTKFSVSAVGVFFDEHGRVLLLHHVFRHHYPWGLPAGFLAAGESPEAGILRELWEETGFKADTYGVLAVKSVETRHLEIAVSGNIDSTQKPRLNHEIFEAVFADPANLPDGLRPSEAEYVAQAKKASLRAV